MRTLRSLEIIIIKTIRIVGLINWYFVQITSGVGITGDSAKKKEKNPAKLIHEELITWENVFWYVQQMFSHVFLSQSVDVERSLIRRLVPYFHEQLASCFVNECMHFFRLQNYTQTSTILFPFYLNTIKRMIMHLYQPFSFDVLVLFFCFLFFCYPWSPASSTFIDSVTEISSFCTL